MRRVYGGKQNLDGDRHTDCYWNLDESCRAKLIKVAAAVVITGALGVAVAAQLDVIGIERV